MEDAPFVAEISAQPAVYENPRSRGVVIAVGDTPPPGVDVTVTLPDGRRFGYAPNLPGPDAGGALVPDPLLRGNAFVPTHRSPRALAAMLSVAAGRRVDTGPESERVVVVLRGNGLVFLQNEDTIPFKTGDVAVLPPGEPARLWAQGPDDLLAAVFQPAGEAAPRRTLASEIAKRRAESAL